jgi:hypothetical protein
MASWKKVIVSGSDAILNQLNVGTNQVITTTTPLTSTKITGSFTGSFFGDGTGITGITATGLNIPGTVTVITNEPFVVSGSAALQKITLSDVLTQITGSTDGGLTKSGSNALRIDTGSSHFVTGSRKAIFETGRFVDSAYIDFTVTSGVSVTGVIISGSIQNGHLANSAVTIGNTSVSLGNTATSLAGLNFVYATGLSGSFITASSGINSAGYIAAGQDITSSAGNIKAQNGYLAIGTPGVVAPAAIAGEIVSPTARFDNLTVGVNATLAAASVTNNLTVGGNLTVNGTASFVNSTNLYVKDQFVLLNSGSTTLQDSGIVLAYSASGVGSAFYLEALPGSYGRFSIAYNVSGTATTVTHDAYMVAVSQSSGVPPSSPTWGGTTYGFGNMHINSSDESIWIYS